MQLCSQAHIGYMNNRISILTPVKNVSKWITQTYQSIITQSNPTWEWIIIDDHSTDDTFAHLLEFANKDSRIHVFKANQMGIIPALQQAFQQSTGEFITRMDGDDLMPKERLQSMLDKYLESDVDGIITGKVKYFSENAVSEGYSKYENWLNDLVDSNQHAANIFRECVVASPNWLMKRSTAEDIGLFEKLQYPEDYDMCFQWLNAGLPVISLDKVTLLWREHPHRTSRNSNTYQQESFFRLKLSWFNRMFPRESIGILGYGTKGKLAAKQLEELERSVNIYVFETKTLVNTTYRSFKKADIINTDLLLIAIYPPDLNLLESQLFKQGYQIGKNAFYL